MRSWVLYIPAGLIEIHIHMKYQLATINRSWDSTLDKNVNLVYGRMDVRTYTRTDSPNALCPQRAEAYMWTLPDYPGLSRKWSPTPILPRVRQNLPVVKIQIFFFFVNSFPDHHFCAYVWWCRPQSPWNENQISPMSIRRGSHVCRSHGGIKTFVQISAIFIFPIISQWKL